MERFHTKSPVMDFGRTVVLNDPDALKKFQQVRGELISALSRLLSTNENYLQLETNHGFRVLQSQLEGTENRITVARQRYIKSVEEYSLLAYSFRTKLTTKAMEYSAGHRSSTELRCCQCTLGSQHSATQSRRI